MWEARATYADGTEIEEYFKEFPSLSEEDQQYNIESYLIEAHPGCTWYSVNWVDKP